MRATEVRNVKDYYYILDGCMMNNDDMMQGYDTHDEGIKSALYDFCYEIENDVNECNVYYMDIYINDRLMTSCPFYKLFNLNSVLIYDDLYVEDYKCNNCCIMLYLREY